MAGQGAVKVGPWGAAGGAPRDIKSNSVPQRLVSVSICSIGCKINGFSFTYVDQWGDPIAVGTWGIFMGSVKEIIIHPGEHVIHVSGTANKSGVTSLKLGTNQSEHGPYGWPNGPESSLPLRQGKSEVVAFFSHAGATTLKALGVYVVVSESQHSRDSAAGQHHRKPCPVKVGPWTGHGGASKDLVTASIPEQLHSITVRSSERSGGRIYGLSYTYHDADGRRVLVGPWGSRTRGRNRELLLADGEYVNAISGTHDDYGVTSLRFGTNSVEHAPFGCAAGPAFSVPLPENGGAIGFFGRSDATGIVGIGVYVTPHEDDDD